jgi:hypothetical protein
MFGNRKVCIGLSVAANVRPLDQIILLEEHFVKRFTGHIDRPRLALPLARARDSFPAPRRFHVKNLLGELCQSR